MNVIELWKILHLSLVCSLFTWTCNSLVCCRLTCTHVCELGQLVSWRYSTVPGQRQRQRRKLSRKLLSPSPTLSFFLIKKGGGFQLLSPYIELGNIIVQYCTNFNKLVTIFWLLMYLRKRVYLEPKHQGIVIICPRDLNLLVLHCNHRRSITLQCRWEKGG